MELACRFQGFKFSKNARGSGVGAGVQPIPSASGEPARRFMRVGSGPSHGSDKTAHGTARIVSCVRIYIIVKIKIKDLFDCEGRRTYEENALKFSGSLPFLRFVFPKPASSFFSAF